METNEKRILITNSGKEYAKSIHEFKVLVSDDLTCYCEQSNQITDSEIQLLNDAFPMKRHDYGAAIIEELEELENKLTDIPGFSNPRSVSNLLFRPFVEYKYYLITLLDLLQEKFTSISFELILTEKYNLLIDWARTKDDIILSIIRDRSLRITAIKQRIKNVSYLLFDAKRRLLKKEPKKKKRVVCCLHTARHHHELLEQLYRLCAADEELELIIVTYPIAIGESDAFLKHVPEGTKVLPVEMFRGYPIKGGVGQMKRISDVPNGIINYPGINANYTLMHNAIQWLNPDIMINVGYNDTGRFLSEMCALKRVPSLSVDYSFITNDYSIVKGIKFDYRCTISQAQTEVWKNLKDNSEHVITGFLKYDRVEEKLGTNQSDRIDQTPQLFFASSHGFEASLKKATIDIILKCCEKEDWNLIIKTHPLEEMSDFKDFKGNSRVTLYDHSQISAEECVSGCDLVMSMGSSIVLDALYFEKPYATFTLSGQKVVTDFMPVSNEPFVFKAKNEEELSSLMSDLSKESYKADLKRQIENVSEKYVFKKDGLASKRVFSLVKEIIQ